MTAAQQEDLFGAASNLPEGFRYRERFITLDEEARLLAGISELTLTESQYRQWTAKRRTAHFGGHYDFTHHQLHQAEPVPSFLHTVRNRLAHWAGLDGELFTHGNVAEYRPGTQLGWHRDVPDFEVVVGVSLAGVARMRFRPYPPAEGTARATAHIDLQPCSAYIIRDAARWQWQHAISPTRELRYSITFRTLRSAATRSAPSPAPPRR